MDYESLHKETLAALQQMVLEGKITEEIARRICADFVKKDEDEKVRKELVRAFTATADKREHEIYGNGITYGQVLDWLEKQGEQKTEIKYIYPKFRVGDVIEPAKPDGYSVPVRVKYIGDGSYFCESDDRKSFLSFPICNENEYVLTGQNPTDKVEPKLKVGDWILNNNGKPRVFRVEKLGCPDSVISSSLGNQFINTFTLKKQYHLWTIQDAKDGDVLYSERGAGVESIHLVNSWKKVDGENTLCSVCTYRIEDDEIITGGLGAIWWHGVQDPFSPATKEQRDLLFSKMKEAGYEWDAEKKELKKIEQHTQRRYFSNISTNI